MCAHEHVHIHCMHTLSFKLINMDGHIYTHHAYSRKTAILAYLTYTYNYHYLHNNLVSHEMLM